MEVNNHITLTRNPHYSRCSRVGGPWAYCRVTATTNPTTSVSFRSIVWSNWLLCKKKKKKKKNTHTQKKRHGHVCQQTTVPLTICTWGKLIIPSSYWDKYLVFIATVSLLLQVSRHFSGNIIMDIYLFLLH